MSYQHLTIEARSKIEVLIHEGYTVSRIAKIIGYHRSTVYRELKRCQSANYDSNVAQKHADNQHSLKGRKPKYHAELLNDIREKLEKTWSPEQIIGRDYLGKLSFKTIYNWIYQGILNVSLDVLRHKGKRQKPKEMRGRFNIGTSISKRPRFVRKRQVFGHWELDTMVSSRGKSKGCLATFAERKSRFYLAVPIPDRSKDSMEKAICLLCHYLPSEALKSFTSDRGKEFACYPTVEALGIDFYFADAYSAWQRGSNENSNGLLREFFPKKTDFSKIDLQDLQEALWLINNRPKKCLNYKTPYEVWLQELNSIIR